MYAASVNCSASSGRPSTIKRRLRALNLHLMRLIDKQFLRTPFYGWPKMTAQRRLGYAINGKLRRLMRLMGIQAIYPRRSSSSPGKGHKRYGFAQPADYACQPGLER